MRLAARTARLGFWLTLLGVAACATSQKPPLPPLEPWGDMRRPYGDAPDQAARRALGPPPPEYEVYYDDISLEDYYTLDMTHRSMRERWARGLWERAQTLRKVGGIDSLGLYLEALHTAPDYIGAYEEAARILLDRGATRRGHALAVQAIRLDPENAVLWVLLAEAYQQRGGDEKARRALEHSLALASGRRTNVVEMLAVLYMQAGETQRADSLLATAPASAPAWLDDYKNAKLARERGDLVAAREALLGASGRPGAPSAVFVELGSLEHELGNRAAAERAYRGALRVAPHERAARNGLGIVQWAQGDLEGAVTRFWRLVRSNPWDFAAQLNLGGSTLQLAEHSPSKEHADSLYAIAEAAFSSCIDFEHHTMNAHVGRAQVRLRRGDLEGATEDGRSLLDSPEHEASGRLVIARAALSAGNAPAAVEQLATAFEAGALSADGLRILGKAYLDLQQASRAVEVLRQAHEQAPRDWRIAVNFGVALSRSGRLAEAESILRHLAQDQPENPDVLQNLAAVLERLGHRREAGELSRRAEKLRTR
ncbi:MAG: tetratricopeptide repeat protein [Candidatus Krumholzibacteriia bacterium]